MHFFHYALNIIYIKADWMIYCIFIKLDYTYRSEHTGRGRVYET